MSAWLNTIPAGTTGIPPLDEAVYTTQEALRQAIRNEKRRELMFEDAIRWVDLFRWDKEYLKDITQSPTDDHLYFPVPPDEIIRNPKLVQNPAISSGLILSVFIILVACQRKEAAVGGWSTLIKGVGSYSSPRAIDLNGDHVKDIVMGAGKVEFQPTRLGHYRLGWQQREGFMDGLRPGSDVRVPPVSGYQ